MDDKEFGLQMELKSEKCWREKKRGLLIETTMNICRQLERRLVEIQCQESSVKQEMAQINTAK